MPARRGHTYQIATRNGGCVTTNRIPPSLELTQKIVFFIITDVDCGASVDIMRDTAEGHATRKKLAPRVFLYTISIEGVLLANAIDIEDVKHVVREFTQHLAPKNPIPEQLYANLQQ